MPETRPPGHVSVAEAASRLGISRKAVEQALHRGSLPRVKNEETGRVWIPEDALPEYQERRRQRAPTARRPDYSALPEPTTSPREDAGYWQEIAERQAVEVLRLQARIAELEGQGSSS